MGYKVDKVEGPVDGKGPSGVPSSHRRIAAMRVCTRLAEKPNFRRPDRSSVSKRLGLPITHWKVWEAAMEESGLGDEYRAELDHLAAEESGTGRRDR
jgi:hypothetical protein